MDLRKGYEKDYKKLRFWWPNGNGGPFGYRIILANSSGQRGG